MSLEQWMLGCFLLLVAGILVHALATGRVGSAYSKASRSADPVGYWLGIVLLLIMLGLLIVALRQATAEERVSGALFAAPIFLYALVETLRTGEARSFWKEPFRRACRPAGYWTHVVVLALLLALSAAILAEDLLR